MQFLLALWFYLFVYASVTQDILITLAGFNSSMCCKVLWRKETRVGTDKASKMDMFFGLQLFNSSLYGLKLTHFETDVGHLTYSRFFFKKEQ